MDPVYWFLRTMPLSITGFFAAFDKFFQPPYSKRTEVVQVFGRFWVVIKLPTLATTVMASIKNFQFQSLWNSSIRSMVSSSWWKGVQDWAGIGLIRSPFLIKEIFSVILCFLKIFLYCFSKSTLKWLEKSEKLGIQFSILINLFHYFKYLHIC